MPLDARAAAARVIAQVQAGKSLNQALPGALDKVPPRDRGLLQQLCYGTLRHAPRLQALLRPLLNRPLRSRDSDVQALLLCGLYQLDQLGTPEHAAVAATVEASRALNKHWAGGMVNAVLRRFLREREALVGALDEAAAASHPRWLYNQILAQWPRHAAAIVAANNQQPPMTLRVNRAHCSRETYLSRLEEAGIEGRPGAISAEAVRLVQPRDVHELPGFDHGDVSVQDEAAQLAAHLLGASAGERVLDACAAPGGKTCHILELEPRLATLVAMDADQHRLGKVQDNLERLGLSADVVAGDAGAPPQVHAGEYFDRMLVDAPCSASGVIRRHPDVKLLRRAADLSGLAAQQLRILTGLWPLLKPRGVLLYATCSIFDEENSAVIAQFLGAHKDAQAVAIDTQWGEPSGPGRQLLPDPNGGDGLFYCLLEKTPSI